MKTVKIFVVIAVAMTTTFLTARAQGSDAAFEKGSKTLGFALGFGVDYGYGVGVYGGNGYSAWPAFMMMYDQGFFEDVGPGTIGIGGVIGYKSSHYNSGYKYTHVNLIIGVRGTYHLTILKEKNNKFDPYAGITVGLRFYSHHDNDPYDSYIYNDGSVYPVAGAFIGAKYNVAEHFGFFAEAGYDISLVRIGFNINF